MKINDFLLKTGCGVALWIGLFCGITGAAPLTIPAAAFGSLEQAELEGEVLHLAPGGLARCAVKVPFTMQHVLSVVVRSNPSDTPAVVDVHVDGNSIAQLPLDPSLDWQTVSIPLVLAEGEGFIGIVNPASEEEGDLWIRGISLIQEESIPGFDLVGGVPFPDVEHRRAQQILTEADASSRRLRQGPMVVQVMGSDGLPVEGSRVILETLLPDFRLGTKVFERALDSESPVDGHLAYRAQARAVFDELAVGDLLRWERVEPVQGEWKADQLTALAQWASEGGLRIWGGTLLDTDPQTLPPWFNALEADEQREAIGLRDQEIESRLGGTLDGIITVRHLLKEDGSGIRMRPDVLVSLFRDAKIRFPRRNMYLLEDQVLTGSQLPNLMELVEDLLARGISLSGIALQASFTNRVDVIAFANRLDRLGSLRIPLRIVDLDFAGDGREAAEDLDIILRLAYGHRAVEGIDLRGFWAVESDLCAASFADDFSVLPPGEVLQQFAQKRKPYLDQALGPEGLLDVYWVFGRTRVLAVLPNGERLEAVVDHHQNPENEPTRVSLVQEAPAGS